MWRIHATLLYQSRYTHTTWVCAGIYGAKFPDEKFILRHDKAGVLSMVGTLAAADRQAGVSLQYFADSSGRATDLLRLCTGKQREGHQWQPVLHHSGAPYLLMSPLLYLLYCTFQQ